MRSTFRGIPHDIVRTLNIVWSVKLELGLN